MTEKENVAWPLDRIKFLGIRRMEISSPFKSWQAAGSFLHARPSLCLPCSCLPGASHPCLSLSLISLFHFLASSSPSLSPYLPTSLPLSCLPPFSCLPILYVFPSPSICLSYIYSSTTCLPAMPFPAYCGTLYTIYTL